MKSIDERLRKANKQITEALIRDNRFDDKSGVIVDISSIKDATNEEII